MKSNLLSLASIVASAALVGCSSSTSLFPEPLSSSFQELIGTENTDSICRRNLRDAAKAAARVNGFRVIRLGKVWATGYHYDATNPGGTFVTGCQGEVVFDISGIVKFRYNVTQVDNQYYVGTAPFNY